MALSGSLNQLLNNCKTTIEGWINTIAAKYLPLSGGTMNSGANITTTTGTITAGKVVVDTNTSIDNGQMHLRVAPDSNNVVGGDANMYLWHRSEVNAGSGGTAPTANREVKVIFRSGNGKDLGYVFNRANTNKTVEQVLCVRSFDDPSNKHWHLAICHSPTAGVYTSAPHPSKLDTNGNIVINTADNSNKIATTYWIRQALPDLVGGTITGTATYAKFPNGTLICAGFVGPVQPGAQVTYPVPFTTRPVSSTVTGAFTIFLFVNTLDFHSLLSANLIRYTLPASQLSTPLVTNLNLEEPLSSAVAGTNTGTFNDSTSSSVNANGRHKLLKFAPKLLVIATSTSSSPIEAIAAVLSTFSSRTRSLLGNVSV